MNDDNESLRRLLEQIRDGQAELLDQNRQLLELAQAEYEIAKRRYDRAEKIQDRAEALQARGEGLVGGARKAFYVIIPILIGMIIYVSWLLFGILR